MIAVCAVCGADMTVVREVYDESSPIRPLLSIEVAPCCTCLSRAASEAEEGEGDE